MFKDKEDMKICYEEFKERYLKDQTILKKLDRYLSVNNDHRFPFYIYNLVREIFPKIFGKNGSRYILYVLTSGSTKIPYEEDMDTELYAEIISLVDKFSVTFACAEKFFKNPLAFVHSIIAVSNDPQDLTYLKLFRADKKEFDFHLDLPNLIDFAIDIMENLNHVMTVKKENLSNDSIPKDKIQELRNEFNKFEELCGDFDVKSKNKSEK